MIKELVIEGQALTTAASIAEHVEDFYVALYRVDSEVEGDNQEREICM